MRTKHWLRIVGLTLALALVAAACGGDAGSDTTEPGDTTTTEAPEETTTTEATEETTTTEAGEAAGSLLVWADENRAPVFEEIGPAFTEATGIEIEVQIVDFGDIREQVQVAGPAGEGPDIFVGAHDWTGELAANGVIAPVDLGANADDFFQVGIDGFSYEGQLYAVPMATETIAMYVNNDLVPAEEVPTAIEDLGAVCEGLEGIENCLGVPGGGDGGDLYHMMWFLTANGGYIFGYDPATGYDTTDIGLASEGSIAGATVVDQLTQDGVMASTNYDTAKNLFLEGSQPFWVTGPWEVGTLNDSDLNWSVVKLPTINGQTPAPFVGVQGVFASAFSENAVVAQSFLVDYVATTEVQRALYDADPRNPATQSVLDQLADDPVVATFTLSGADGTPMPNIPEMGSVWGAGGDNLLALRNGDVGPEEAMTNAQSQVEELLAN